MGPLLQAQQEYQYVKYALYVKEGPQQGWSEGFNGSIAGTWGHGQKTDAFRISGLKFPVEFRIHVEQDGWHKWIPGNESTFDTGVGKCLEAIQFRFPQGIPTDTVIVARAQVQSIIWMPYVNLAKTALLGIPEKSFRLEAIQMAVGTYEKELIALMDKEWQDAQPATTGPRPSGNPNYDPRYPLWEGPSDADTRNKCS